MRLLGALVAQGPGSISELAARIGVDQPRTSRLAQAAIAAGQVRREADPADARRSILVITDAGRAVLDATLTQRRAAVETALSGFTDGERAEFARLLTRFVEAWPREP
ncbi:MarR family winged helix-turn-helix transcriptional regulator [Agromyces sp. G08B096]|uniref:MarR family winged helix-turn-helix transcriptional regulator n=1 Tax=Agromyces sp. G08B096 TaxID=3156399 RepID=A0AAU7W9L2_9MICO